ncbi:MAG TPA: hypothetical protein VME69_09905 [Methylocella sp.]|nr:hypothetical protein [Methylocella sp.]
MLMSVKNYILENPNAFQIVSTLIIGVLALVLWKFVFRQSSED